MVERAAFRVCYFLVNNARARSVLLSLLLFKTISNTDRQAAILDGDSYLTIRGRTMLNRFLSPRPQIVRRNVVLRREPLNVRIRTLPHCPGRGVYVRAYLSRPSPDCASRYYLHKRL
jgi:hypothetical protein